MAKGKKRKSKLIDIDPSIGTALHFDAASAQDFMDRKLRDIEGLLVGVMAMSELRSIDTSTMGSDNLLASSSYQITPKAMLESALFGVAELHTVASELAHRYLIKSQK